MNYLLRILFFLFFLPSWISLNIPHLDLGGFKPIAQDTLFYSAKAVNTLENSRIAEASGLAFSHRHKGLIYTHNDSGGRPYIFLIDTLGQGTGYIRLLKTWNRDWEDIAVGPGPDPDKSYVYVGDIGDNVGRHNKIYILRFPEPDNLSEKIELEPERLALTYPEGARDAETLMIDPIEREIFILTKRDSMNSLYKVPIDAFEQGEAELEFVQHMPITFSVAGDISKDGSEILIKNYFTVFYWKREKGETIPETLKRDPLILPYRPEPQGEAIGFDPSGNSYYTLSEKRFNIEPVLYRYNRKPPKR